MDTLLKEGLEIGPITEEEFLLFAKRFGTSEEVGPIGTCLDKNKVRTRNAEIFIVGLSAGEKLCAVAAFQLFPARDTGALSTLKLDSIIVDPKVRKQGFASLLVYNMFIEFCEEYPIKRIYTIAMHPGTVKMLSHLSFSESTLAGAALSSLSLENYSRRNFTAKCRYYIVGRMQRMKLEYIYCINDNKRPRPWCKV